MAELETPLPTVAVRMATLVECLCAGLNPGVCYCGPFFGGDTPMDYCAGCDDDTCGQAWVRLVQAYPSASFPTPDLSASCSFPLAYEWEVGIARCAPTVHEDGSAPSRDENLAATIQQYQDMVTVHQAIACCFGTDDVDYILGPYTPGAVLGGCVYGVWQVFSR